MQIQVGVAMAAVAVMMMQVTVVVQGCETYHVDGGDGQRCGADDYDGRGDLM